ncbi:IS4 family transposase [Oryzisolibacter sp. LB2S]|uniref:IS4 family transposase n=1 Tax=Alicycliphilus soli TaxID=3228789 RepID=UPI00345ABD4E
MHAIEILRDTLARSCPGLHKRRLQTLMSAVEAALHARSHTLSNLARALSRDTSVRQRVKCVDRLLGNAALQRQQGDIYAGMARQILAGCSQPVILVDWTDLKADRSVQMIRASLALHGRSLSLLEQVYPCKQASTPGAHQRFLRQLKVIVGDRVRPIIVTDAGFRTPWFVAVEKWGWHWLGRIRGRDLLRPAGEPKARWISCRSVWADASGQATDLGAYECVRSRRHISRLVLVKRAPKGRHKCTVHGMWVFRINVTAHFGAT